MDTISLDSINSGTTHSGIATRVVEFINEHFKPGSHLFVRNQTLRKELKIGSNTWDKIVLRQDLQKYRKRSTKDGKVYWGNPEDILKIE